MTSPSTPAGQDYCGCYALGHDVDGQHNDECYRIGAIERKAAAQAIERVRAALDAALQEGVDEYEGVVNRATYLAILAAVALPPPLASAEADGLDVERLARAMREGIGDDWDAQDIPILAEQVAAAYERTEDAP